MACLPARATPDPIKVARTTVEKYVYEAFVQWSATHPDKACPAKIDELYEYVGKDQRIDPWGHAYRMSCGANLPKGVRLIAVASSGPDGKPDTDDDVRADM